LTRHLVLIGLPGSGKSTVGQLVAEALSAPFLDIDAIISRREGRPIALIFAEHGENAFRGFERQEMETALAGPPSVIAPGGGWAAQPGALESVQSRALLVYLKTRPATAAARAAPPGNRPTLMGEDPGVQMRQLLVQRESFYVQAEAQVETDRRDAAAVAADVVRLARQQGGW
jgi:shikimate kinase